MWSAQSFYFAFLQSPSKKDVMKLRDAYPLASFLLVEAYSRSSLCEGKRFREEKKLGLYHVGMAGCGSREGLSCSGEGIKA